MSDTDRARAADYLKQCGKEQNTFWIQMLIGYAAAETERRNAELDQQFAEMADDSKYQQEAINLADAGTGGQRIQIHNLEDYSKALAARNRSLAQRRSCRVRPDRRTGAHQGS